MNNDTSPEEVKKAIFNKIHTNLLKSFEIDAVKLKNYLNNKELGIQYFVKNTITDEQEKNIKKIISKKRHLTIYEYVDFVDKKTIWNKVFDMNNPIFNKNSKKFAFEIKTDGMACSILFHKKVQKDKNVISIKNNYESIKKS